MTRLYDNLQVLDRLDHFIRTKSTGTPQELANKLCTSKRTVQNYIAVLRDFEARIEYCANARSYCYLHRPKFWFKLVLDEEDLGAIKGGRKNISKYYGAQSFFSGRTEVCSVD